MLPNYITESYYGIILRNDVTILRNHLCEKDPGMPRTSLETPGISRGFPGHAPGTPRDAPGTPGHTPGTPGTPLGPPRDAPGTPGDLLGPLMDHTKTVISRQIDSARSSRLLHSKLLIRAHRMEHSTGPICL